MRTMASDYTCPLCQSPVSDATTVDRCQRIEKRLEAHADIRHILHVVLKDHGDTLPPELLEKMKMYAEAPEV
jgi:hypothetical protein